MLAFDTQRNTWSQLAPLGTATMDHRGMIRRGAVAWIVGGMRTGQQVSATTVAVTLPRCP